MLIEAQQACEEMLLNAPEENLILLSKEKGTGEENTNGDKED